MDIVKSMNKKSLKPLIDELETEPSPYNAYYNRTESQWKDLYGPPGFDIYNKLKLGDGIVF